jgi:hypothetical protein
MKDRPNENLESRLTGYDATIKANSPAEAWRRHLGSWSMYAAAAGSALASSNTALASIIYSGPQNITATISHSTTHRTPSSYSARGNGHKSLNIDGQGNIFKIGLGFAQFGFQGTSHFSLNPNGGNRKILQHSTFRPGAYDPAKLASGAIISSKAHFAQNDILDLSSHSGGGGLWRANAAPAFAGIEFTEGGQNHFGWVQIEFANVHNNYSITAIDWAYNSVAGAPIVAGQTSSGTPEPTSQAMALLSAGFLGVLALRRSRKLAPKS